MSPPSHGYMQQKKSIYLSLNVTVQTTSELTFAITHTVINDNHLHMQRKYWQSLCQWTKRTVNIPGYICQLISSPRRRQRSLCGKGKHVQKRLDINVTSFRHARLLTLPARASNGAYVHALMAISRSIVQSM